MNRTLWDYDIETDRVARFVRGIYWFIWGFLTPEVRKLIQERDRRNIVRAREAATDRLRFQRELEEQRRRANEYRWKRDLEYYSK